MTKDMRDSLRRFRHDCDEGLVQYDGKLIEIDYLPVSYCSEVLQEQDRERMAWELRDRGHKAWLESIGPVNGKEQIVDPEKFRLAQSLFKQAREVDMVR